MSLSSVVFRCACAVVITAAMIPIDAGAQTCAFPTPLAANVTAVFDTCQGDSGLVVACNMFALTGPAAVMRLPLPYPTGIISVQSLTVGYDPAVFLLRSRCDNSAACGTAVDSGVVTDTMDLADVDSGDYFLAIAPMDFGSLACGQVMVTYGRSEEQQVLALDGVFRAGISAPPTNP
jgi:hypothetical protein